MVDYSRMSKFCNTVTENRYQPFHLRECKSDLSCSTFKSLAFGKYHNIWKNIPLMKDPLSLSMYQNLFQEVSFRTIFELGSYEGASALWMDDIQKTLGKSCEIYSFDIDLSLIHEKCKNIKNIHFLKLDATKITQNLDHEFINKCPKPWLVIEDCHVNVVNTLSFFAKYSTTGDYFIVEDTNPLGPASPEVIADDGMYKVFGNKKYDEVSTFIQLFPKFKVDTKYCDHYGYNSSWQWNSVLVNI